MRRLSQTEGVSAAQGMDGWLQWLREPGDQDTPQAPLLVAQERDNWAGLGGGRKRASEHGPADGAQRQQKRHKAGKDSQAEDPPPRQTPRSPSRSRGAAPSLPLPLFSPIQEHTAAAAPPTPVPLAKHTAAAAPPTPVPLARDQ